jgi:3-deoxy-D-manno-octulosonic-acid transferase
MKRVLLSLVIHCYGAAVDAATAFLVPVLLPLGKKHGWHLAERRRLPRIVRGHRCRTVVWVHAASLGEAKLLLQFLNVLEHRNPDDCYVVTATTAAGVEHLERMKRPSVYAVGFLPFDSPRLMASVLETFAISRLWLLETELWPAMLHACFSRRIPVGIANARVEERSFARYRKWSCFLGSLLEKLDIVLAQNETYAQRFHSLGVKPERLHVVGNLKTCSPIQPPRVEERSAVRRLLNLEPDDTVIVAGSFHAGEGALAAAAMKELEKKEHSCRLIVVPRYLREADALAAELDDGCLRTSDLSTNSAWTICLIEKLGVLEAVYRIADAAIVGGTFIDIGGHNVWEAAQNGIPVFFGPHYYEQRSGCEKLLAAGVGFMVTRAEELAAGIEKTLWTQKETFRAARAVFTEVTDSQQAVLEPLLP